MSEPATEQLFRDDAYKRDCTASVMRINERGGIILDKTVLYANSGGQPGDTGRLETAGGAIIEIAATVFDGDKSTIVHVPAADATAPQPGDTVTVVLDWEARLQRMRMHTCLHLLCSIVPYPVTGGQIGDGTGRLDFNIEDASAFTKEDLTAKLNELIGGDHATTDHWITDEEMAANPDMIRTMAVKPPMGTGRVRIVNIGEAGAVDSQPCGGTHVRATGEIGVATVTKIEKKGRQNRRIRVALS